MTAIEGAPSATAEEIVDFWREAGRDRWFVKDEAFDAALSRRFSAAQESAARGDLDSWQETATGSLALLLLLDQFPRNMFRGSPRAFATDAMACRFAEAAIARGFDRAVPPELRSFFYMPFMHAENLADQDRCLALLADGADPDGLASAREHRDIIARFGRFPHRNKVLGRPTTAEEAAYLAGDGFKG